MRVTLHSSKNLSASHATMRARNAHSPAAKTMRKGAGAFAHAEVLITRVSSSTLI